MNTLPNDLSVGGVVKASVHRIVVVWAIALLTIPAACALEINQANEAELDSLKGMGPVLSASLLKIRAQRPFKDWADLMHRVAGIRQHKAQQFSDAGLTVNGQAFNAKP